MEVEPLGSLQCTLLDRRSGTPLSDALVTCVIGGNRLVQLEADARGHFRASMPQGVYELVISARGELKLSLRGIGVLAGHTQQMTRALVVGPTDEVDDGAPSSAIGGWLTDRLNHPVANAAVTATGTGQRVYTTSSDRDGAYIIHDVKPDKYDVTIRNAARTLSRETIIIPAQRSFHRHDVRLLAL